MRTQMILGSRCLCQDLGFLLDRSGGGGDRPDLTTGQNADFRDQERDGEWEAVRSPGN